MRDKLVLARDKKLCARHDTRIQSCIEAEDVLAKV